jgi:hypothetical protein
MANEPFDVSMLEVGRLYVTEAYGTVRLDRWDTYCGETTAEIVLLNGERRNPLPTTLAAEIERARQSARIESIQTRLANLLADARAAGLNIRVWNEPRLPLKMGSYDMRSEVYPSKYERVETHAEKANG